MGLQVGRPVELSSANPTAIRLLSWGRGGKVVSLGPGTLAASGTEERQAALQPWSGTLSCPPSEEPGLLCHVAPSAWFPGPLAAGRAGPWALNSEAWIALRVTGKGHFTQELRGLQNAAVCPLAGTPPPSPQNRFPLYWPLPPACSLSHTHMHCRDLWLASEGSLPVPPGISCHRPCSHTGEHQGRASKW